MLRGSRRDAAESSAMCPRLVGFRVPPLKIAKSPHTFGPLVYLLMRLTKEFFQLFQPDESRRLFSEPP